MIFVLRLKINDQQLQMLMLSFLFVILFGLFQSTKIFACYCHCFFAGVQIAYLFGFLCCVFYFICLRSVVLFRLLLVSLECQILIVPSGFSNLYVYMYCR